MTPCASCKCATNCANGPTTYFSCSEAIFPLSCNLQFPLVSNGAVSNAARYEHRGTPTLVVALVALRSDAAGFYGSLHGLAAYPVLRWQNRTETVRSCQEVHQPWHAHRPSADLSLSAPKVSTAI